MSEDEVLKVSELSGHALAGLLSHRGLELVWVEDGASIPGSYWGEREAGLIGNRLYLRADTPVHSALHEACHYLCMEPARRGGLHTDAGGSDTEESAVCYLQALLAPRLAGYSRERLFADMDAWGYHFRLGSTRAWFEADSDDAQAWLAGQGLLTPFLLTMSPLDT
ncbi:MAG: hypothetical protein JWQ90_1842 [Hydrocarboniphaga sp.]|uniref:hypothetical protein n=1 Tax=Hydrocarboniphaga sp. TaxID=2033016 RepID=UPI00261C9207|nr:hypothetical protein [Hydrocarboniphaga sp.]MDB5969392.1 hypothetical protein [Hydrocarboniphaga sp.]